MRCSLPRIPWGSGDFQWSGSGYFWRMDRFLSLSESSESSDSPDFDVRSVGRVKGTSVEEERVVSMAG
jgi:hypothetical protein